MVRLSQLPPELLLRIVNFVSFDNENEVKWSSKDDNNRLEFSYSTLPDNMLTIVPRSCIKSLGSLRQVSKSFSQLSTPLLFRTIRVLPDEESAARYNNVLKTDELNKQVSKVIFQTRIDPEASNKAWGHRPQPADEYAEPHGFFLDAMEQVGQFSNLTHAELVFSSTCESGDGFVDNALEDIAFREQVLATFYKGLNHKEHPAGGVFNLSIKNLQNITPNALIPSKIEDKENERFKQDFEEVMSRITHLSLQIATEDNDAAPEHTLEIPACHDFFGHELQTYWLAPIATNLVYLKLYAHEMYWGMFPQCNLPNFPALRTLVLGNMSIAYDEQVDWILSHAATLQELLLDDAILAIGAKFIEHQIDTTTRHAVYSLDNSTTKRPSYQPKSSENWDGQMWLWPRRWHDIFPRFQKGLPKLKSFVFGQGPWLDNAAFDEAHRLKNELLEERYQLFDQGTGPSNWLESTETDDEGRKMYDNSGEEVYAPDCDKEDREALEELLAEVKKRRRR